MNAQVQAGLAKTLGAIFSSRFSIRALAGSHPIVVGAVLGIGAYYTVNKYWQDKEEGEAQNMAETTETPDEVTVAA